MLTQRRCYAKKLLQTRLKHTLNDCFLANGITSHKHAWFWGMFISDGSIHITKWPPKFLRWNQKYSDYQLLINLRNIVNSNATIKIGSQNLSLQNGIPKMYHKASMDLFSSTLATDALKLLECNPSKKSFDVTFPSHLNSKFYSSFLRGLFDGDGSIVYATFRSRYTYAIVEFCSANKQFLTDIQKIIQYFVFDSSDNNKIEGYIRNHSSCFSLAYQSKYSVIAVLDWLYEYSEENDRLGRKFDRYNLYKRICKLKPNDRKILMSEHIKKEKENEHQILQKMKLLCLQGFTATDNLPIGFAPSFVKWSNK